MKRNFTLSLLLVFASLTVNAQLPDGSIAPNFTATDINGNAASCTATVTVEDRVAPVALCQDITVQLDSSGSATITPEDVDGGSSDACGFDLVISKSTAASATSFTGDFFEG